MKTYNLKIPEIIKSTIVQIIQFEDCLIIREDYIEFQKLKSGTVYLTLENGNIKWFG